MKLLLIFSIILLTLSCSEKPKEHDDLYVIIDELLRYDQSEADLVILELNKVIINNSVVVDYKGDTLNVPPPPPPPGCVQYARDLFANLENEGFLNSREADFMYMQIDSLKDFVLDSSKIERQSIRYSKLIPIFRQISTDSGYRYLEKTYKAHSFIRFSTPLISKNGNKLLLTLDYYCGRLCGGETTYLFEKKNDKWRIIYKTTNWIS
jgi:hypothetical protein